MEFRRWPDESATAGSVIWAGALSLELALNALANRASYVVTEVGSPHGHAAIQLMSQGETEWILGLSESEAIKLATQERAAPANSTLSSDPDVKHAEHYSVRGGGVITYFNPSRRYTYQRPASDLLAICLGNGLKAQLKQDVRGFIDKSDRMGFESNGPIDDLVRRAAFDPSNIEHVFDRITDLQSPYERLASGGSGGLDDVHAALHSTLAAGVIWHWHYSELYASLMKRVSLSRTEEANFLLGLGRTTIIGWVRKGGLKSDNKLARQEVDLPSVGPLEDALLLSRVWTDEQRDRHPPHLANLILLKEWSLALTLAALNRLSIPAIWDLVGGSPR